MAGGDVRVDERISQLLGADKILTLADGGKYILLELPHQVFIDIEPLLAELASAGLCPIISHPERHPVLAKQPQVLLKWLDHSSYLQITAASLLGGFGSMAEKAAWNLLSSGWACLVATDAHDLKARRPCMTVAFEQISLRLGKSAAQLVCIENPLAVSQGSDIGMLHSVSARNSGYERDHNNS